MVALHQRSISTERWFKTRQRQSIKMEPQKRQHTHAIFLWTFIFLVFIIIVSFGGFSSFIISIFPTNNRPHTTTTGAVVTNQDQHSSCPNPSMKDPNCHPPPTWNLQDATKHCNIPKYTLEEFQQTWPGGSFPLFYDHPIIIVSSTLNKKFQQMTTPEEILNRWDSETITLPQANVYSFGSGKTMSLYEYIFQMPETLAFDYAHQKPYMLQSLANFSQYQMPTGMEHKAKDRRLGVGTTGSGAQWHMHGPGFCEVLHGVKHWALVEKPTKPKYESDFVSRHWFEYQYTSWVSDKSKPKIWECTLYPGDAIYFPHHWFHTTVNLDRYTVFVTSFLDIHEN